MCVCACMRVHAACVPQCTCGDQKRTVVIIALLHPWEGSLLHHGGQALSHFVVHVFLYSESKFYDHIGMWHKVYEQCLYFSFQENISYFCTV